MGKSSLYLFLLLGMLTLFTGDSYAQQINPGETVDTRIRTRNTEGEVTEPSKISRTIEAPEEKRAGSGLLKGSAPNLITQTIALTLVALMPFVVMLLTSFIKIVIVLSLLRSALGAQQAPPNQVINGVALLLSVYIMYPTGVKMYEAAMPVMNARDVPVEMVSAETAQYVIDFVDEAKEPFREFMIRNSSPKHHRSFHRIAYNLLPPDYRDALGPHDFIVVIPSYITGQLKSAFEIGVLIYIPFFVIDLVTSNILLAMGMMMLSPVTISMPLKLFLLVMLDGWTLLVQGLVGTFV